MWKRFAPLLLAALAAAPALPARIPATPERRTARPAANRKPAPPAAGRPAAGLVLTGPLDILALWRRKQAALLYSRPDAGSFEAAFDENTNTFVHTPDGDPGGAPAVWQVTLDRERRAEQTDVVFAGEGDYLWSLAGAAGEADMAARRGSYRLLVPGRRSRAGEFVQVPLPRAPALRVFRLEARRAAGAGGVSLAEWSLWAPQRLTRLHLDTFAPEGAVGEKLQLRAYADFDGGGRQNMTPDVAWQISPPDAGRIDNLSRFEAARPGRVRITARANGSVSEPLELTILPRGKPDWDVLYIERTPRLDFSLPDARLVPGQIVQWVAYIKNYGTARADPVAMEWRIDGKPFRSGRLPEMERFGQTEVILTTRWEDRRQEIELVIDPRNEVEETCEGNNALAVHTDALCVGFWVEQSNLQYFHRHQRDLGAGSNSWEDWAQRQIDYWNRLMAREERMLLGSPAPQAERWRLDRILVVGDGLLPLASGEPETEPDARDRSVHLMCGFPAYDWSRSDLYRRTTLKSEENPFFIQTSLLAALGRVRFHRLAVLPPEAQTTRRAFPAAGPAGSLRLRGYGRSMFRLPR